MIFKQLFLGFLIFVSAFVTNIVAAAGPSAKIEQGIGQVR